MYYQIPPVNPIETYTITSNPLFTISLFVLSSSAHLPIHDHPSMRVITKLLMGSLRIQSYTLPPTSDSGSDSTASSSDEGPCPALVDVTDLTIVEGGGGGSGKSLKTIGKGSPNLHSLHPLSETVVFLDIQSPPYSDEQSCTYYEGEFVFYCFVYISLIFMYN
jgi:hypothetical protein